MRGLNGLLEWTDGKDQRHKERVEGFLARLYQHEEAHLRGKLNLDEAKQGGIVFVLFDPLKEKLREKNEGLGFRPTKFEVCTLGGSLVPG